MIRVILNVAKSALSGVTPENNKVELYGDTLWPWLRCFIAIWVGVILRCGVSPWFEAVGLSSVG